jgi:hypothetical protein
MKVVRGQPRRRFPLAPRNSESQVPLRVLHKLLIEQGRAFKFLLRFRIAVLCHKNAPSLTYQGAC